MPENNSPQWHIEVEYIQSCNCAYGCPCNFNALPTDGNCEALVAYHVLKGNFGDTQLNNVVFAWGLWWPEAIHMGNGIGQLYVDKNASSEQVKAIEEITSGKHGGGVFAIFPTTLKEARTTITTEINFEYGKYDAGFTVAGAGKVKSQHIKNAATNENFEAEIVLPGGIAFKKGTVTSVDWDWQSENISLKHELKNGHMSIVTFSNEGCIA
ncbi:MAG: DUF1326 domain-containing protein [Ferruginibacter sp.]